MSTPVESAPAPEPSHRRAIIGAVVSVIAVGGCVLWASKQPAPHFPDSSSNWAMLGIALLIYVTATLIRGWRWDVILRAAHVGHRHADAYALVVVGYMGNTVLPARGGEALRIVLLSERSGARRREILGAIIPERVLDVAALAVMFAALTFAGTADRATGTWPAIGAAGAVVLLAAAGFVYLRLRIAGKLEAFAERVRPVARASRLLLTPTGVALGVLTIAVWSLEGVVFWFVTQALDVPVTVPEAMLVVTLASLSAVVPAGPGYVGTYDAAALFALHAVDVHGGAAVSCILLFRFVIFVPVTCTGLILMVTRYGGLGAMRQRADQPVASGA